jgi:hypothetical protein
MALRSLLTQTPAEQLKAMGTAGRQRFLRLFTIELHPYGIA